MYSTLCAKCFLVIVLQGLLVGMVASVAVAGRTAIPRPEHPRPQMERSEWFNLNGVWEFAETNDVEDERFLGPQPYPERITVPFCRESRLSGLERKDLVKNVWYRRTFRIPDGWSSPRTRLHVGACDWRTRVWINGEPVGEHTGGSVSFAFDITPFLKDGENTLVIHAYDDTASGLQALGKQSLSGKSHSIFYTPTTGIWQTVWLEGVGSSFIREFRVDPDPDNQQVLLNTAMEGPPRGLVLRATVFSEGKEVASMERPAEWRNNSLALKLSKKRLWTLSDPFLYDLTLALLRDGKVIDKVNSYFGLRRVKVEDAAILINDEPVFQRLILDQGFYPDGIWTAPREDDLRKDIELSMACGFNGARLHQKVFEPRLLYWADKLGYLLWGEFPSFQVNYADPAVNGPMINEWMEIVARDRNHPSIIGWCPFNETPGEAARIQATVVALTRALDPSRPVIESSGWVHTIPDPEVLDAHDYNQDPVSLRERWNRPHIALPKRYSVNPPPEIPFFISEYGGIGWQLDKGAWGYGNTPENIEAFYTRFQGLTDALLDNRFMFGLCYTQLTDIEQECNGLYFYDRKPKFDVARLKKIMGRKAAYEKDPPRSVEHRDTSGQWSLLVEALQDGPLAGPWRYTTDKPPEGWTQSSFDDETWNSGNAPFGQKGAGWQDKIRTPWKTKDLWLRQQFTCDSTDFDLAALVMHHDDDVSVYLNGKQLFQRKGWTEEYACFVVTDAAREALIKGNNVIAVHVYQDHGGQYFDTALLLRK